MRSAFALPYAFTGPPVPLTMKQENIHHWLRCYWNRVRNNDSCQTLLIMTRKWGGSRKQDSHVTQTRKTFVARGYQVRKPISYSIPIRLWHLSNMHSKYLLPVQSKVPICTGERWLWEDWAGGTILLDRDMKWIFWLGNFHICKLSEMLLNFKHGI